MNIEVIRQESSFI